MLLKMVVNAIMLNFWSPMPWTDVDENGCNKTFRTPLTDHVAHAQKLTQRLAQRYTLSHARTVVRECCKGDDESQWERGKFDPPPPKNPLTDGHKNLCR